MPTLSREQRVAIAIGAPIAAILLYILFRRLRSDEFDDEDDVETDYNEVEDVASTSETTVEVKVPRSVVGQVIGKGGANIKKIQKESGARLNFMDDEDEESSERTAIIRGEREKVKKAELLIKKVIAMQPVVVVEEVYVPMQACGRIIGRGGQNIRQISRFSGAKVAVERSSEVDLQTPLRKVTLTGTTKQILHARGLLEEKVTEEANFAAQKVSNKGKVHQVSVDNKEKDVVSHLETGTAHDTVSTFPAGSEYVKVFVSALSDPSSFHVQLITEKASALETMNTELTKENQISAETSVLNGFKTGDLCCAPFDVDNCWYRARVTKIGQDDMVDVFYVDFGDSGQVAKPRLRVLKNKYRTLPHQAVHCSLANCRPKDGRWSEAAKETFEELTFCAQWRVLMARVIRYCEDDPCVELVDTNNSNEDINIGEELVKRQFAVFDEYFPTESDIKHPGSENLELNQEPTVVKDDSSRKKINNLENKRALSIEEYDLRTAKKTKADKEFLTSANTSILSERGKGKKEEGFESIICKMEDMTVTENASPSNLLIKQQIPPECVAGEEKEVARAAQDNQDVLLRTYTPEEPVQAEATAELLNQSKGSSVNDPKYSAFVGKDLPRQTQVTDDGGCPSTLSKEDNEVSTYDKQSKTKDIAVIAPTEKKTYVSSVSVITKKKAKDVFVTVSSSDKKRVEEKNLDGLKIQPTMSNMTSKEAKRASTELVINVSSNTDESLPEVKKIESEEKFTSTYNTVLNTGNSDHDEYHASAIKTVPKPQQGTVNVEAVADFDSFVTSATSYESLRESPDNSDTDSFLSAREEVTSETDTTGYLTAQASGSTTSLDYQSLDSDADTVQLDISLETAHTPVNSDLEDNVDVPTTPRSLFSTSHYGDRSVQGGKVPSVDLTENELGYGADTESVTSKEDLRQFGVS